MNKYHFSTKGKGKETISYALLLSFTTIPHKHILEVRLLTQLRA